LHGHLLTGKIFVQFARENKFEEKAQCGTVLAF
jgi:hypothetical protein